VLGQLPDALDVRLQRFAHGPTSSLFEWPDPDMDRRMSQFNDANGSMRERTAGFFHFPTFLAEVVRSGSGGNLTGPVTSQ
jgi:hypothetical protein